MTVAGVLLAAGAGSRFAASRADSQSQSRADSRADSQSQSRAESLSGSQATNGGCSDHKLTAQFRGRPLISWALEAAAGAGFNQLYVITGAIDVTNIVADVLGETGATVVHNPDWAAGQATSLDAAVRAATADGHRAIVIGLADQPLVPTSAWRSVGAAAGDIVTASFDGARRPPVKIERSVWASLPRTGDEGARSVIRLRPELVSEIPCTGNPVDIDTLEDLQQWS